MTRPSIKTALGVLCGWVLLLYLAPKLIGAGMDMASHIHAQGPLQTLAQALELEFRSVESIGPDLRLIARLAGRSAWFE